MNDDPVLYRNTYRIRSTRLRGWDYAWAGRYFITICTRGRIRWFGECRNGRMRLSDVGMIVAACWQNIPAHFGHASLDAWIVMPDHMHGIVVIGTRQTDVRDGGNGDMGIGMDDGNGGNVETCDSHVSTTIANAPNTETIVHIPRPAPGSLGSVINQFKTACTKRIRGDGYHDFAWQPRFHDHLIRNEREMSRIREYIDCNPMKWDG